jgi:prevent-host-death family protein
MITAGIKELKNSLSHYLRLVRKGEDVLVTERGKVIARIVQERPEKSSLRTALHPLITMGLVSYPERRLSAEVPPPVEIPGKPISEMVLEDRR